MNLKFEVKDKTIQRKNIQVLASKKSKCFFTFVTKDWWNLEKYVIFWTKDNKSTILYLGKGKECFCKVPKKFVEENLFSIQVYANDEYVTDKLNVGGIPEGYTIKKPEKKCTKNKKTHKNDDPEILLYSVFSKLETKIDNILYKDGYLICYSNEKIVCKTPIFRDLTYEIRENIKDLMPYFEVKDNGDIYAIYPYDKGE